MTTLTDGLHAVGVETLGAFWLPLLVWTVVALAVLGLLRLWRSAHTLVHYAARAALLLALPLGLALAAVTEFSFFPLLQIGAEAAADGSFTVLASPDPLMPGAAPAFGWTLFHGLGLAALLAALLGAIRLAGLARNALALRRFRMRLPASSPSALQHTLDRHAATLGLRRRVQAVVTTRPVVPMTLGWRRPVVVVPEALLPDTERLDMVLLHELIHIRRRDALMQGIEQMVGALFAINPAVWLLRRSLLAYREMACDAEVLTLPRISRKQYATLLYSFATPRWAAQPLALGMASSQRQLKKRILAMKSSTPTGTRFRAPKGLSLALAALLLASATLIVACSDVVGHDEAVSDDILTREGTVTTPLHLREEVKENLHALMQAIEQNEDMPPAERKKAIAQLKEEMEQLMLHADPRENTIFDFSFEDADGEGLHEEGEDFHFRTKVSVEAARARIMDDASLSPEQKKQQLARLKEDIHRLSEEADNHFIRRESNRVLEFKFGPDTADDDANAPEHNVAKFGDTLSKEHLHQKEATEKARTYKKKKAN